MVALRNTTAAMHTENGDMLQLARHNREDATRLKILTRITIFYLPATLIAVRPIVWVYQRPCLLRIPVDYIQLQPDPISAPGYVTSAESVNP